MTVSIKKINSRVANSTPEDLHCDYKESISLNSADDRRELAKDVSGFANASGGMVIVGVPEDKDADGTGIPRDVVGIERIVDFEDRVTDILRNGCSPSLPAFRVHELPLKSGKYVYVVEHPRSWNAPHMVTGGRKNTFHKRVGTRTVPMSEQEVANAYRSRYAKEVNVDQHIQLLNKDVQFLGRPDDYLAVTVVPVPTQHKLINFSESHVRAYLDGHIYTTRTGGSPWKPCGSSVIALQNWGEPERNNYVTTLHPSGALFHAGNYLADRTEPIMVNHIALHIMDEYRHGHIATWLEFIGHKGPVRIHVRMTGLVPGKLTAQHDLASQQPRAANFLFKDEELSLDFTMDAEDVINDRDLVVKTISDRVANLIGLWEDTSYQSAR